ncbi:AAA family ATPase [Pelagibaculum spongiae]|uniref:AAA family ATPase n=1 Tax=Pelagibaculum spongiae TaxID=2080658 RepID=A0A2V1GS88_9GAMM|nr:MoxR family ATPase [Pelagibaculum spongiae]PVZ68259.1 AAA family ATPase [Pelagibaculum spongiae]
MTSNNTESGSDLDLNLNDLEKTNDASNSDDSLSSKIEYARQQLDQLKKNISKALIGQYSVVEQTLVALLCGGHVLLEGVPGLGKTLLVQAVAKSLSVDFSRIQFTPDLMPADVTGHALFDMKNQEFTTRKGPVFTNLLLADEINRAPAKTQAALLEVMQERQVTIEGESFLLDAPFMVLATQNPLEQEGTYPLPEAQLDRFMFNVMIDYPTEEEELNIVEAAGSVEQGLNSPILPCMDRETLSDLQALLNEIVIDHQVVSYAVELVRATRDFSGIRQGAGPRASISLVRAARALALVRGRAYVTPEEIKQMVLPVLRHRIFLSAEAELEGLDSDRLLVRLLEQVPAPRL